MAQGLAPAGKAAWLGRSATHAALAVIVLLAAAARLHHLGQQSLWIDEAFSYGASRLPWSALILELPFLDKHPPLYYALLKLWSVFGDSEAAMRSLSALLGIATVPLAYVLGRETAGRTAGLVAALFIALQPMQIAYGQEARMYAGLAFGMALLLASAAWLTRRPQAAARPMAHGGAAWAWGGVVAGATLALWFHNTAPIAVLAVGAGALPWVVRHRREGWMAALAWGAAVTIGLLWLPNVPYVLAQTHDLAANFWIDQPSLPAVAETLGGVLGMTPLPNPELAFVGIAAAGWGLVAAWRAGNGYMVWLLIAAIVLTLALQIAAGEVVGPIFLDRPLLWLAVPFAAALGAAIAHLPRRGLRVGAAGVLGALLLHGAQTYHYRAWKEPWREATAAIDGAAGPDEVIVTTSSFAPVTLCYYWRARTEPRLILAPPRTPAFAMPGCHLVDVEQAATEEGFAAAVKARARQPGILWLVVRAGGVRYADEVATALSSRPDPGPFWDEPLVLLKRYP